MARVEMISESVASIVRSPAGRDAEPDFEPTTLDPSTLVLEHADFVFRLLRRAGLDTGTAEDGAQQVFLIITRKIRSIAAGKERSFIYATAKRIAADLRRRRLRRGETELTEEHLDERMSSSVGPEDAIDKQRARNLLDEVLAAMPAYLRDIFVLCELEELTAPEVAACLDVPLGTVASRLARARRAFDECLARVQARRALRRST